MYDAALGRFPTQDRFSEKYLDFSPYQYGANNPIKYIDVNGDSLWISHNGNQVLYENGNLYSVSNGNKTQYKGPGAKLDKDGNVKKYTGFLGKTTKALNEIGEAEAQLGTSVISGLQGSDNNFTIENASNNPRDPGSNEFADDNTSAAYATAMLDAGQGNPQPGGSGGTIYWNPSQGAVQELGGRTGVRTTTNLAHELFHGYDANRGLLDNRPVNGLKRSEGRASYFENRIRSQRGLPYREYYNTRSGAIRLLDVNNKPISVAAPQ